MVHLANYRECDVRYYQNVLEIIDVHRPQKIFHLAAQSYPTISWLRPTETIEINIIGTTNIFEAIKKVREIDNSYDPIVVSAGSSAEYGASLTPENLPVTEDTPLLPLQPYGVSKVAQDLLGFQYHFNDGIKTIRARIFNTTGPRKVNDVLADFTKRAVQIEKGRQKILKVGNLKTTRAITDVRDTIVALDLLSDKGKYGDVYNICGKKAYLIGALIPIIQNFIGRNLEVEIDPKLLRPSDEEAIFGDSSKLKQATGWKQSYSIERTISDMIDYWRSVLT